MSTNRLERQRQIVESRNLVTQCLHNHIDDIENGKDPYYIINNIANENAQIESVGMAISTVNEICDKMSINEIREKFDE